MYIKSILDLEKAYAADINLTGMCDVECTTQVLIEKQNVLGKVYIIKSTISLPWDVVHEFVHAKAHTNIASSRYFDTTDLPEEEIQDIFKKIHFGYLELIKCQGEYIQREFINPKKYPDIHLALGLALALTPPPSPSSPLRLNLESLDADDEASDIEEKAQSLRSLSKKKRTRRFSAT